MCAVSPVRVALSPALQNYCEAAIRRALPVIVAHEGVLVTLESLDEAHVRITRVFGVRCTTALVERDAGAWVMAV